MPLDPSSFRCKVLVLEEDESWQQILRTELGGLDGVDLRFEGALASDAAERVLGEFGPNIVIMAWKGSGRIMPGAIKRHCSTHSDPYVVVFSAYRTQDLHKLAAEADLIISKANFPPAALRLVVRERSEDIRMLMQRRAADEAWRQQRGIRTLE